MKDKKGNELANITGAGGCFRAGSQVQLAGGKTIAIELLKEGDEILSFDERGEIHAAKVIKLHYHADPQPILHVKFWRGEIFATPNHWVLNQYDSFAEIGRLSEHDSLVDGMGHLRPIIGAELIGYEPVYNLTVEPHHTFIINDIRVHNGGHRERYPVVTGSGGGGGGKGGGRTPVEAADSVASKANLSLIDLVGEGEIGGLVDGGKSIYLNNTPLINSSGQPNFEDVVWEQRTGTPAQTVIEGFTDVETPYAVGVEVLQNSPQIFTITNPMVDRVRAILTIPSLFQMDSANGDINPTTLEYKFEISTDGGAYVPFGNPITITEKTGSKYQRSHVGALPKPGSSWSIRLTRITPDSVTQNIVNKLFLETYVEILDLKLNYPNSALVSMKLNPTIFSSVPKRGYRVKGLIVQIPTNYNPVTRVYTGVWDGTFKTGITDNPAWILYDLLVVKRYGMGDHISATQVDKAALYKIGRYCDELVPNGYGGNEPRFTVNTVISSRNEAYKLIADISSVFRGMMYWAGGVIGLTQDSPQDPSMIFSQANVKDGVFNYTSSPRKDRHSVVLVTWNNPDNGFKQEIEYVENHDLIKQIGVKQLEVVAFGCSSRGQAHRVGKWILYTEAYESNVISFSVGADASLVVPGEIVKIHDAFKAGKRFAGRIIDVTNGGSTVTLDSTVTLVGGGSVLSVKMPDGTIQDRTITNTPGDYSVVNLSVSLTTTDLAEAMFVITEPSLEPQLARVIAIGEGEQPGEFIISAVEHNASKFNAIDFDAPILVPNTSINDELYNEAITAPVGLAVTEVKVGGNNGLVRDLLISWDKTQNKYIRSYALFIRKDSDQVTKIQDLTFSHVLKNVQPGQYRIELRAETRYGTVSQPASLNYTVTPLFAITDVSVLNIGVKGAGAEFMGRNAEIHWETNADVVLNLPISYSNGTGGSTQWFRDFEVKIFTANGLTLLRTDYTTEYSYSYTMEKNIEDGGPRRTFKVEVRARDEFGNYSTAASMVPFNNPPQMPPVIETIPREGSLSIKWASPADPDYRYARLFGSKTSGFTPDDTPVTGNLLWTGMGNFVTLPIDAEDAGTWYLRMQFVDEFGLSGAIYSAQGTQIVTSPIADLQAINASDILPAVQNFNASNDRNAAAVVAPTVPTGGVAIDHTTNADGSINMSFEWAWSGNEGDIDGFGIVARSSTNSAPYTLTGTSSEEVIIQVPASKRAYIHHGLPAYQRNGTGGQDKLYYTVGVVAFRKVDKDIAASGVIASAIVKSSVSNEDPYCPATMDATAGDIVATISGIQAANVNKWQFVTGTGRPFDNADVTKDQISGSGINILNSRYAVIDESDIPPYTATLCTASLDNTNTKFGLPAIRVTPTGIGNALLRLSANTSDYNFIITPNKKWLVSAYVRGLIANSSGALTVRGNDGNVIASVDFLTSPTPNTWTRVSGVIDASANASSLAAFRLDNDSGTGNWIDFTGLMMEELIGNIIAPSAFVRPAPSTIAGVPFDQVMSAVQDYNSGNNRNASAITNPVVPTDNSALDYGVNTDGSANITFEWTWAGNEGDIDGFAIFAYTTDTNHGTYTFGTNPAQELVIQVPADRRAYVANGVPADAYYTVGVAAYRAVDKDINASGVIASAIVYANGTTERPFRPTASIDFGGNLSGTVGGTAAATVVNNAANGNTAFGGTVQYRSAGVPTNNPAPSGVTVTENTNGTRDIRLDWDAYAQGTKKADALVLFYKEGTTALTINDASIVMNVNTTAGYYVFQGVDPTKTYRAGIAAARKTENGWEIGTIQQPTTAPDWQVEAGSANYTANIGGTAAATVVSNASNGSTAFSGTAQYRSSGVPTNNPAPASITVTDNANGSRDIRLDWAAYTQGAKKADFVMLFYKEGSTALTINDASIVMSVNSSASYYVFQGVDPSKAYRAGIAAARRTENGIEIGIIQQPTTTPNWSVAAGTANYTANVNGVAAATVVGNAANGAASYDGTTLYRTAGAPTNNPTPSAAVVTENNNGTRDIKLSWTGYTQGAKPADLLILFYKEGTGLPTINDAAIVFNVNSAASYYIFTGVNPGKSYSAGIAAARKTENGLEIGTIVADASWQVTWGNPNYTARIAGVYASTIRKTASSVFRNGGEPDDEFEDWSLPAGNTITAETTDKVSGTQSILFQSTLTAPTNGGATGGASVTIPAEIAVQFAGKRVRVSLYAKQPATGGASEFAVQYSTGSVGNSGWVTFTPTTAWAKYEFTYDVAASASGGVDYLGIWGDKSGTNLGVLIDNVVVECIDANAKDAYEGTVAYRSAGAPTNNPAPTSVTVTENSNGTRDIRLNWGAYTQGALKADTLLLFYKEGTTALTVDDASIAMNVNAGAGYYVFQGVDPTKTYRAGIAAARKTENGWEIGAIQQPTTAPDWRITAGTANYTASIGGVAAATVVGNAANGATSYDGTVLYRTTGAPTNAPSLNAAVVTENANGSRDIRLPWAAYTQGAKPADLLILFYKEGTGALSVNDAAIAFNVNTAAASYYTFTGIDPSKAYTAGLAAARKTENGLEIGAITTIASWSVTAGTANYTANVGGTAAATVVSNASDGKTAHTGTVQYRTTGAPTNNPTPSSIDVVENTNGSRDITLHWNAYTQGAKKADMLAIIYKEGTAALTINDEYVLVNVNTSGAGRYTFKGVDPAKTYRAGICALRKTENGFEVGAIQQPTATPDWQVEAGTPNVTANIAGVPAANIHTNITSAGTTATWSGVTGTGKPSDNADVTLNQMGGRGVNVCHPRYTTFEASVLPPLVLSPRSLVTHDTSFSYFGGKSLRLEATDLDAYVYMSDSVTNYNMVIHPNKKWLISAMVRCSGFASKDVQLQLKTSGGTHYAVSGTTSTVAGDWKRISGVIDLTSDNSTRAVMRVDNEGGAGIIMYFDGLMIEEQFGTLEIPSPLHRAPNFLDDFTGDLSATKNVFTVSTSSPTGGNNGDVHFDSAIGVLWAKMNDTWSKTGTLNATEINAGTLNSARIAAGSIDANKLNVGVMSAITANLGTVNAGSITGTAGISITGEAKFQGDNFDGNFSTAHYAVLATSSGVVVPIIAKNTGGGTAITANSGGTAVNASSTGTGYGVDAQNTSGSGGALYVNGPMFVSSSSMVSNLNANYVGGYSKAEICSILVGNNGTATASSHGFNVNTSTGMTAYEFYATGSSNFLYLRSVSDEKLKTDIQPETLGLDFVNALRPKSFRKKADPDLLHHGFIAQDLEKLIGTVNEDGLSMKYDDGTLGFDYQELIGPLVLAIQKLSEQVTDLKEQLEKKNG